MSDSSIALKPVIDEPSKPIPSSSARLDLARRDREALQVPLDVREPQEQEVDPLLLDPPEHAACAPPDRSSPSAPALDLRHALPPFKHKSPGAPGAPEAPSPHELRSVYSSRLAGQPFELGLAAMVRDRAAVERERRSDHERAAASAARMPQTLPITPSTGPPPAWPTAFAWPADARTRSPARSSR